MFAVVRHDPARLNPAQAVRLARRLHRAASAWARTFLAAAQRAEPGLVIALRRETLAFGLTLLAQRLQPFGPAQAAPFLDQVRRECAALETRPQPASWRASLPAPAPAPTEFDRHWLARVSGGPAEFEITPDMFGEFCQFTGLSSRDLVGHGDNVATLVFYLVVHGRIFASQSVPVAQRRALVRSLRECRCFVAPALEHWLTLAS